MWKLVVNRGTRPYLVSVLVGNHLDHAVGVLHRTRPAVGHEGELAGLDGEALLLGLVLSDPHRGNLGMGVADGGDGVVVHVALLAWMGKQERAKNQNKKATMDYPTLPKQILSCNSCR